MNKNKNINKFSYETYKNGRIGLIETSHGVIETPAFVFCGTKGAIKGLDHQEILQDTQILLCNTFHLHEMAENIEKLGGLHKFINWQKPIITDSGGFQIFSLGNGYISDEIKGVRNRPKNLVKITEEGCYFKNPKNGNQMFLSAELSIKTQIQLGVDFVVSFDECTTSNAGKDYTRRSMERSHRWEKISLDYFNKHRKPHQSLYGIIQGGIYEDLRSKSIDFINENDFFGICIGGSLGKTKEDMENVVKFTAERLDKNRPVHLLGIGFIEDVINFAPYVDTFDCVEPTRIARHGNAINPREKLNLKNSKYLLDDRPLCEDCDCLTCQKYSRAYIHYLIKAQEMSCVQLLVRHNIHTMNKLMKDIRNAIMNDNLEEVRHKWIGNSRA